MFLREIQWSIEVVDVLINPVMALVQPRSHIRGQYRKALRVMAISIADEDALPHQI